MNQLISRIDSAIAQGELPFASGKGFDVDSLHFADALLPYEQVFGVPRMESNQSFFGYSSANIAKRIKAQRKTSRQPLPAPRPCLVPAPMTRFSPSLWDSISAVLDHYRGENIALEPILAGKIATDEAQATFLAPLIAECQNHWPLTLQLEDLGESMLHYHALNLYLPALNWDEEGVSSKICFLEGPESAAGLLASIYEEGELENSLPAEDVGLIAEHGLSGLMKVYVEAQDPEKRRWFDFPKLENHWDTFFGELFAKYPKFEDTYSFTICTSDILELPILDKDAVAFAKGYADAFETMIAALPGYGLEENDDNEAESIIHHICEIFRAERGMAPVEWSPEGANGEESSCFDQDECDPGEAEDDQEQAA